MVIAVLINGTALLINAWMFVLYRDKWSLIAGIASLLALLLLWIAHILDSRRNESLTNSLRAPHKN